MVERFAFRFPMNAKQWSSTLHYIIDSESQRRHPSSAKGEKPRAQAGFPAMGCTCQMDLLGKPKMMPYPIGLSWGCLAP